MIINGGGGEVSLEHEELLCGFPPEAQKGTGNPKRGTISYSNSSRDIPEILQSPGVCTFFFSLLSCSEFSLTRLYASIQFQVLLKLMHDECT